jgi:hypothetical protein
MMEDTPLETGQKSHGEGRRVHWAVPGAFLLLCVVIVLWHEHFGFIQFGGMDGGVLINLAWSQYQGLTPYVDIPCYPPVLFAFPAGWAFDLWGPTWAALTHLVSVFSVLTFSWSFLLLWKATHRPWMALTFATALQVMVFFSFSWWWYNQVTAIVLALYFGSVTFLLLEPKDRFARISFWAAVALTALAKPNTAGILLVLTHVLLLTDSRTRIFVLLASSSAALADLFFLLLHHITPVLLLQNYLGLVQRLVSVDSVLHCLSLSNNVDLIWMSVFFVVTLGCLLVTVQPSLRARRLYLAFWLMFLIALVVGLVGAGTNSESKINELTCLVMFAPFLGSFLTWRDFWWPSYGFVFYFVVTALIVGVFRLRVFSIGPSCFAEHTALKRMEEPALFRGMMAGPRLFEVISEAEAFLRGKDFSSSSGKKIFFGPRIDFLYAAFHLPVESGLPLWWEQIPSRHHGEQRPVETNLHAGGDIASRSNSSDEPLDPRVQRFIDAKFDYCVFVMDDKGAPDMTFMPADIHDEIYEHYHVEFHGALAIFTRF